MRSRSATCGREKSAPRRCHGSATTRSTLRSNKTIEWEDGNTYPVVDVEISSATHPFYTGQQRVMDTQGRVEKFKKRYGQS